MSRAPRARTPGGSRGDNHVQKSGTPDASRTPGAARRQRPSAADSAKVGDSGAMGSLTSILLLAAVVVLSFAGSFTAASTRAVAELRLALDEVAGRGVISAEQHAELLSAVEDRLAGVVLPSRTLQYPDGFPPYPDSSRQWPRPVRGQRELDELCKDWAERPSLAARVDCAVDSYAQRTGALTSASEFSGVAKRVLSGSSAEEAMLAEAAERDHEAGGGKPPDNTRVDGSESHSDAAGATAGASRAPTAAAPAFDAAPSVLPKGGLESAQIGSFQQPGRSSRPKNKKVVDLSSGAAAPASLGGSLPTAPIVAGDMRTPGASAGMPPPVGTGGAAGVAAAGRTLLQQPPPSTTTRVPLPGEVDTAGRPVEPHAQAGRPLHLTVNLGGQLHTINFQQGDASWTVVEPFCADHKLSAEECELVRGEVVKLGGR